jgi:hypothetical protein
MRVFAFAPAIPFALVISACGPAFVVTDSFTPAPEGLFASPPDSLHDYAVGTEVVLVVHAARAFIDLNKVEVVSKTPDLLEVIEQGHIGDELRVRLRALTEGTASLALLDDQQRPIEERVIEVKLPDTIALAVNIDTERGFTIPKLDPEGLLIATGGTATFRVTYQRDGAEVMGKNVLRSPATDAAGVFTFENAVREKPDREFLTLTAPVDASEEVAVPLEVDGQVITTVQVRPTSVDEVATIQLDEGTLPSWRNNGDETLVWAKAFTEDAVPIFGVPFAWTFDSAAVEGGGDLITYAYAGGERRRIQVGAGEAVEDLTVEAADGSAKVTSTANPGCASTPAPLALALCALAIMGKRTRFRRTR